jgi:hypothetical protein
VSGRWNMTKQKTHDPSEEATGIISELDSIPVFAKLWPKVKDDLKISGEASSGTELLKLLKMMPEDEVLVRAKNHLRNRDYRELSLWLDILHCATALNRHDALQTGNRFASTDYFEPIPWIWVTGEPNTDRMWTVELILSMCPERSFEQSATLDCEWDDQEFLFDKLFGSYFDPHKPVQEHTPPFVRLDAGFLIFYKAEKLSPMVQKKLIQWREKSLRRAAAGWTAQTNNCENESRSLGNPIILSDPRQEVELTDVAVFFVADRSPWELVDQGLIMRELASGSIHIVIPPLRECPKLIIHWLRDLIIAKPTLTHHVPDPLKYWSKGALELVSSFHWPDNLAGLRCLVDTLFFKGLLRSGKEKITEDQIRAALSEIYGPSSGLTSDHPLQPKSKELASLFTSTDLSPDQSEWIEIFRERYQGRPGAITAMATEYGINRSLLSKTLNAAGINTGKGGRPRKNTR